MQQYARNKKIPYRWILLDSWWYFKGEGGGVANWTVRPDIFPEHGGGDEALLQFHQDTQWPIGWFEHSRIAITELCYCFGSINGYDTLFVF